MFKNALNLLSHLPAGPIVIVNVEVLKEDVHGLARGNGNGDVAIHFFCIVAGKSWTFYSL